MNLEGTPMQLLKVVPDGTPVFHTSEPCAGALEAKPGAVLPLNLQEHKIVPLLSTVKIPKEYSGLEPFLR